MGKLDKLTREAVFLALEEFDKLGRLSFLERYGFGKAQTHYIVQGGRHYDAKAIAGVAHRYLRPNAEPLFRFKSGERTVNSKLRELGFDVQSRSGTAGPAEQVSTRNSTWNREELILALDSYVQHAGNPPSKESKEIAELSALLNRLGERLGRREQNSYRNPNGVYMKLMNFRRFDPTYTQAGRTGLSRGGKLEEVVWHEFAGDRDALRSVASLIRAEVELPVAVQDEYDDEAAEGAIILALHRRRERNRELITKRKRHALRVHGDLRCEGCDMSFPDRYGERGKGFIEVHHTKPLHLMEPGDKTRLSDLALVCANCHRMIHRRVPWLTVDELRKLVVPS